MCLDGMHICPVVGTVKFRTQVGATKSAVKCSQTGTANQIQISRRGRWSRCSGRSAARSTSTPSLATGSGPVEDRTAIGHAASLPRDVRRDQPEHSLALPRHVREQLGNDDHDPTARGHNGRRDEPKQRRTIVDPSLGRGQHPRHTSYCASSRHNARRTCSLPQLLEQASHSCPLCPRWHLRRLGHEQSMAAPVFGRMGSSRSHGPLRRKQGLNNWVASTACPQRCPLPRHSTPTMSSSPSTSSRSPLPKTPWTGPWQKSDDDDDASMPDAPLEPEIIDMPPAPASPPPMSNLERCIALRLV